MKHEKAHSEREALTTTFVEIAIRLCALALLVYLALTLLLPFLSIAIWSTVIAVALDPAYERLVRLLRGRRRIAAAIVTLLCLVVVIGPATWLVLDLIDSLRALSAQFNPATLAVPPPANSVKTWPLIGERVYQFWALAATNLQAALATITPYLQPLGSKFLSLATDSGIGIISFFVSIIIAGFLLPPAPTLSEASRRIARRLAPGRGEAFVDLAGATIRTVSRGVIGVSALQAFLAGIALFAVHVPGASLITSAVLIFAIIQIGPTIVLVPVVIWSWFTMEPWSALLFTAYIIPVNFLDNILRPLVMGRGLDTPLLVILIGVIGGTLAYGITGLFLGPIVLAVIWELMAVWISEREAA